MTGSSYPERRPINVQWDDRRSSIRRSQHSSLNIVPSEMVADREPQGVAAEAESCCCQCHRTMAGKSLPARTMSERENGRQHENRHVALVCPERRVKPI